VRHKDGRETQGAGSKLVVFSQSSLICRFRIRKPQKMLSSSVPQMVPASNRWSGWWIVDCSAHLLGRYPF